MFKVKDEVVYPGHGVAVIQEAVETKVGAKKAIFFKLSFKYKDMTILVPSERLETSGVRFVSKQEVVDEVLEELLKEPECKKTYRDNIAAGWSKRQKDYQSKIESGMLIDVAKTYRDLRRFSEKKTLSFGEKGLMLMAEDLLSQEILAATKLDKEEVLKQIRLPFEKIETEQQELI